MDYNLQKNQNAEQTYHSIRNSIVSAQHRLSTAVNSSLPKYISNFPYFTGFPACALAKRYVFSLIFALMR